MKSSQFANLMTAGRKTILSLALMIGAWLWASSPALAQTAPGQFHSKWDEGMLSAELHDVQIEAGSFRGAWDEIVMKYLLRANLYMDAAAVSDETEQGKKPFAFHKEKTTGKELFDAILAAYPAMTYTQSKETGIIWFHPKRLNCSDILSLKVRIAPGASHVPMYPDVYLPLCKLLGTNVIDEDDAIQMGLVQFTGEIDPATGKRTINYFWFYDVDLPAGVYSAREILDFCCAANPTKAFEIQPVRGQGPFVIFPKNLLYNNPLAPPRAGAVRFWELGVGKPTNGAPSYEEFRAAMCDPDPVKRCTASLYEEACMQNYPTLNLIEKAVGPEQAVWTALGVEYAEWRDAQWTDWGGGFFSGYVRTIPRLQDDLKKIEESKLALLMSLQLTRKKQDTGYLDAIVSKHKYSDTEIAAIKPELYRIARSSKAVRDKLREMKLQVPALSAEVMKELENTNFLTLVPEEKNR
jgi:hypothetical protein